MITIFKFNLLLYDRKETFNQDIKCLELDLANFASIHEFSGKVISKERKLDYLICNAGIGWDSDHPKITSDGQVFKIFLINLNREFNFTTVLAFVFKTYFYHYSQNRK